MKSEQLSIFPPFSQSKDSTASQEKEKEKGKSFEILDEKNPIFWYPACDAKNDLNQKKGNQKSCSEK